MPMTAVSADRVAVSYGDRAALGESTFEIPGQSVTAVIGPNGSGKSTLLNLITGLTRAAGGTIRVAPGPHGGPLRMSYVLQATKVNEALLITVREVVTMARYATAGARGRLRRRDRDAVAAALERMGLAALAGNQLHELSSGQRQRVFVAQGLAQEHDVLVLDEPMTGLDLPSAQAIDDVIHAEQERGATVVMATHDLAEAMAADHVILLANRVVAWGPPAEVLTADHLAAAYGASLLHLEGGRIFIDDPAHTPVGARHLHRERVIHVEPSAGDAHGGD